jgi:hypothetical protein
MKQDKEIEQILLNDEKYEQFIKEKTEKDFNKILKDAEQKEETEITDFKKMKSENLFLNKQNIN